MKVKLAKKRLFSRKKTLTNITVKYNAAKRLKKSAKVIKRLAIRLNKAKAAVSRSVKLVKTLRSNLPKVSKRVSHITSTTTITGSNATAVVTTNVVEVVRVVYYVENVINSYISDQEKRIESIDIAKAQTLHSLKIAKKKNNKKEIIR